MSSIDNRIVKMVFDNSQFKSKAEDTLNMLTRLRDALSSEDFSSDLDTIDISISQTKFDGLVQSVEELSNRFSSMGIVGMTVLSNLTTAAMDFAANGLQKIMDPILTGGFNRAAAIENARFTLQGVLGDFDEVERVLADAKDSVDGTAFAFNDAALASAAFAATGLKSGQEMQSVLKAIAGTAATANTEYSEIAHIFTTIAGNGRVMTEQLNQFSYRGMNAAATLTNAFNDVLHGSSNLSEDMQQHIRDLVEYGMTELDKFTGNMDGIVESDLRELVSKSKIDFETFSAIMAMTFGDHAKDANKTFNGSMANIRAALARTGEMFYSGLIKQEGPLVQFFNAVRVAVNGLNAALGPVAEAVTEFASGAIYKVADFINMFAWIKTDDNGIKTYSEALLGLQELFAYTTRVAGLFWNIIDRVFGFSRIVVEQFANDWGYAFHQWASSLTVTVEQLATFQKAVRAVKNVFDGVVAIFQTVGSIIGTIFSSMVRAFDVSRFLDGVLSLTNAFKMLAQSLVPSNSELKDLGDVFYIVFKLIFDVGITAFNGLAKAVEFLASILQYVAPVIRTVFRVLSFGIDILGLVSRFLKAIIDVVSEHVDFSFIANGLGWIMDKVHEFANLDKFQEQFTEFIDGIKAALDTNEFPFLTGLGDAIEHIKDVLGNSAKFISEKAQIIGEALKKHLGKAFEKLHEIISTYWPIIKQKIEEFRAFIAEKFSAGFDKLRETVATVVPIVKTKLQEIGEAFAEFMASGKLQKLGEAFADLFGSALGIIKSDGATLGEKIGAIFGKIKEAFSDTTMNAMERLTNALTSMKEKLEANAPTIREKLTVIKDGFVNFMKKIGEIFGGENGGAITNFLGFLFTLYMVKKLLDGLSEMKENVPKNPFAETLDAITGAIEEAQKTIKSVTLMAIATAIVEIAGAMFLLSKIDNEKIIAVVLAMFAITKVLKSMMDSLKDIKVEDAKGLIAAGFAIIMLSYGVNVLADAVVKLAQVDFPGLVQGLGSVILLMLSIKNVMDGFSGGFDLSAGLGLIGMAIALSLLVPPIKELGAMDLLQLGQGLVALGVALGEMGLAMRIGSKGGASEGLGMIGMAIALNLLMGPLREFAAMDVNSLTQGLIGLGVALGEMGASMMLAGFGGGGASIGVGMILMAVALGMLIEPLRQFGSMDLPTLAQGLIGMGVALAELAAALYAMSGSVAGAIALTVAAFGLKILADAIVILSAIPFMAVIAGVGAFAIALAALAAVSLLLSPVLPMMMTLGITMLTIGAGAALLTLAFLGLIVAMGLFGAAFLGLLETVTSLIDPILAAINDLINGLAEGIRNNHDGFFEACGNLFMALWEALVDLWNNYIVPWWNDFSQDLPYKMGEALGWVVQAISKALPSIIQGAKELAAGFIDSMLNGSSEDGTDYRGTGEKIVDLICQAIGAVGQWLVDKGKELAGNIVNGLLQGVEDAKNWVGQRFEDLGNWAYNGFAKFFGIASPSKLMAKSAGYIVDGLVNGMRSSSHKAADSMASMASDMVDAFETSAIEEYSPTITPVMDLSNIQNGIHTVDDMLGTVSGMASIDQSIDSRNVLAMDSMSAMLNDADYSSILNEMGQLRTDLNKYSDMMSNMKLVMDTGTLVGELTPGIDRNLGRNVMLAGRRV